MIRALRVLIPSSVLTLLISEIILIFLCYFAAGYFVTDIDPVVYFLYEGGWSRIAVLATLLLLSMYFSDLYGNVRVPSRIFLFQHLCLAIGICFLAQALFSYLHRDWTVPARIMLFGSGMALFALFGWRVLFGLAVQKVIGFERVLFLGSSPIIPQIAHRLHERPELGFLVLGYLDEECDRPPLDGMAPRLGCLADLDQTVAALRPDRLVVAMRERRGRLPVNELIDIRFSGIQTEEVAHLYETAFLRVCAREIRPSHLVFSSELGPRKGVLHMQTLYSAVIAAVGLTLTAPLMAVIAILIRITSPGPVLLRQTRVGLHDKPFSVLKFRSMYADAEARTGAVWATENDPRITPLGRWLRLLRFDELPQLINVLRGEMAIVGPRPERPEFVQTLNQEIPFYRQRHCIKPGITGWAQINYRYGNTIEDTIVKLEYDLYYIKNMSATLDAFVIFHTVKTMLLFRGAR